MLVFVVVVEDVEFQVECCDECLWFRDAELVEDFCCYEVVVLGGVFYLVLEVERGVFIIEVYVVVVLVFEFVEGLLFGFVVGVVAECGRYCRLVYAYCGVCEGCCYVWLDRLEVW
jgi:hypothetical protein